jgi:hypothetical protein
MDTRDLNLDYLWALLERPSDRVPMLTEGEIRVAVELLHRLAESGDDASDIAQDLAMRLQRRLPALD